MNKIKNLKKVIGEVISYIGNDASVAVIANLKILSVLIKGVSHLEYLSKQKTTRFTRNTRNVWQGRIMRQIVFI